jgi:hypothetical protein
MNQPALSLRPGTAVADRQWLGGFEFLGFLQPLGGFLGFHERSLFLELPHLGHYYCIGNFRPTVHYFDNRWAWSVDSYGYVRSRRRLCSLKGRKALNKSADFEFFNTATSQKKQGEPPWD